VRLVDGGVTPFWYCQSPGTGGCPQPRPRLGSPCTSSGYSCDYGGGCTIQGGTAQVCTNGVWTETFEACPL
jgi:hypothetical protein